MRYQNYIFLFVTLSLLFILLEVAYRILDPFPYFPDWETEKTKFANITEYDDTLGWKGVPNAHEFYITDNAKTLVEHNALGFRDIQPEQRSPDKAAIIFLGDSYTWGEDVNFNQMFINIIRKKIKQFEIYNLAHRGYGTDQSLFAFQKWGQDLPLNRVILMFCKNDVVDNDHDFRWGRSKPKFVTVNDTLFITNLPVPRCKNQETMNFRKREAYNLEAKIKFVLFQSHFLHDLYHRMWLISRKITKDSKIQSHEVHNFLITDMIIRKLAREVSKRNGKLTIVTFPSLERINDDQQHKQALQSLCEELAIDYLDLTPLLKKSIFRTEYRGGHWNARGHKIVAGALDEYFKSKGIR